MARRTPLVCQYLENISRDALEKYHDIIQIFIRRRHGIYALFRKKKLYYVGLASNLRSRLKAHLRDRHHNSWDRFSVYLTLHDSHVKELESLILRIWQPQGNSQRGKFYRSENLSNRLAAAFRARHRQELSELLGRRSIEDLNPDDDGPEVPLAKYFTRPMPLRGKFKGKEYKARVRKDGRIRFKGKTYATPSAAGTAVRKRQTNGWYFWRFERAPGDWVRLKELR